MKLVLLLSFLVLLSNCTTISLRIPGATIESPEAAGKKKKELGPSLEPAREIEYTDAVNARPPDLDNARARSATHTLLHQGRFGLGDRFELGVEAGLDLVDSDIQTALMLTGKFQFLGPNKSSAKAGDLSGGIYGKLGWVSADGSGNQSETFGPGGYPWSADIDAYYGMIGTSFGLRLADPFLLYLGGSYQHIVSKLEISQGPADDNSDPGGNYGRERDGRSLSYGLGAQLRLGRVFYFHGKLMMFNFYMDGIEDEESLYAGGGFHFYF